MSSRSTLCWDKCRNGEGKEQNGVLDCYLGGSIKAVKKRVEQAEDLSGALQQEETALMRPLRQRATGNGARTKKMK
jgi:hypothetical protein